MPHLNYSITQPVFRSTCMVCEENFLQRWQVQAKSQIQDTQFAVTISHCELKIIKNVDNVKAGLEKSDAGE